MLKYFDTHSHLFSFYMKGGMDIVRNNYISAGLSGIIEVGSDLLSSRTARKISESFDEIYYAVGVHPSSSYEIDDDGLTVLKEYASSKKCVAIGEIGLDYHYDDDPSRNSQKYAFVSQLELAHTLKLPVVIHSRECTQDIVKIIKDNKRYIDNGILFHCFSDSFETARELMDLNTYFSFGGALTFKNSKRIKVLEKLPMDRVMFETDCPYMSPVPLRGTTNEPKNVIYVYKYASENLGIEEERLKEIVSGNIKKIFGINV